MDIMYHHAILLHGIEGRGDTQRVYISVLCQRGISNEIISAKTNGVEE